MKKVILMAGVALVLVGCASPNFKLNMGLYRSVPEEVSDPMLVLNRINAASTIPLTPEQIKAFLESFVIPGNRTDVLYLELGAKSQIEGNPSSPIGKVE